MKKTIFDIKIPTFAGIFIILIGILTTSFFTQKGVPFISRASTSDTPQNIRISNIFPTSFTISYTTPEAVLGSITYGLTEKMENTVSDDPEENNPILPKTLHMITVKNLNPQTQYFFSIISGETTYLDNGKPFAITTAPNITTPVKESRQVTGTIIFSDDTPKEAIIYIATKDSQTISAKVDKNSKYNISLKDMRDKTLNNYATITPDTNITMLMVGNNTQSNVTVRANQTNPVPSIILSKTYDFTINDSPIATPASSAQSGFPDLPASPSASTIKTPQIASPKNEESITDTKPMFKGVASPSADVIIEIHSDEAIKESVVADKNGSWTFRPKQPLSSGDHTITMTTRDQFGILKTITQSFTVYAQGSQVGQSATPSATVIPQTTTSPTPTTIQPTPTPNVISLTPTLTLTPTLMPTNTPIPTTQMYPPIEPPGNSSLFTLIISAFSAIITGFMLLRFLRNKYIS